MKGKINFKKILSTTSITSVFIVAGIFVFAFTGLLELNQFLIDFLGIILVLCFACIYSLPWVKRIENNEYKKLSIIFLIAISFCAVLWIISFTLVVNVIFNNSTLSNLLYNMIRICLVLSMQLLVATSITYILLKYKKSMIPFQIVTYISNLYIDFYISFFIINANIVNGEIKIGAYAKILISKIMITLLIISIIYVAISSAITKRIDKKKSDNFIDNDRDELKNFQHDNKDNNIDEKLEKLKDLFNKNLITKEEYDIKKGEILKDL